MVITLYLGIITVSRSMWTDVHDCWS